MYKLLKKQILFLGLAVLLSLSSFIIFQDKPYVFAITDPFIGFPLAIPVPGGFSNPSAIEFLQELKQAFLGNSAIYFVLINLGYFSVLKLRSTKK